MISPELRSACDNAIHSARRGDTRAGVGLARHAYRLARHESPAAELEALNALALCQSANGAFIESIATSIDAFRLALQLESRVGAAYALTGMAGAASYILDADQVALDMLHASRREAEAIGDKVLLARIHNTFGLVYGNLKRFDDAEREYDAGIALVHAVRDRASLVTPAYLMAGNRAFLSVQRMRAATATAAARMDFEVEAERRVRYVLAVATDERNVDAEARAWFCLGQLRAAQGRADEALAAFGETRARAERIRHHPRLIDTHCEISRLAEARRDHEAALEALELAYELADANRPSGKISSICEDIARMYAALGRKRDAAQYEARTLRERESFLRENDNAVRDLNAFWRTVAADRVLKTA